MKLFLTYRVGDKAKEVEIDTKDAPDLVEGASLVPEGHLVLDLSRILVDETGNAVEAPAIKAEMDASTAIRYYRDRKSYLGVASAVSRYMSLKDSRCRITQRSDGQIQTMELDDAGRTIVLTREQHRQVVEEEQRRREEDFKSLRGLIRDTNRRGTSTINQLIDDIEQYSGAGVPFSDLHGTIEPSVMARAPATTKHRARPVKPASFQASKKPTVTQQPASSPLDSKTTQ